MSAQPHQVPERRQYAQASEWPNPTLIPTHIFLLGHIALVWGGGVIDRLAWVAPCDREPNSIDECLVPMPNGEFHFAYIEKRADGSIYWFVPTPCGRGMEGELPPLTSLQPSTPT